MPPVAISEEIRVVQKTDPFSILSIRDKDNLVRIVDIVTAEKPTLILNGDLLELALTTTNQTAMAFERFVELAMPEGNELFKNPFIFLAGNHDHHLWEVARETQYVDYMVNNIKPGQDFPIPWHVTKMFNPTRVTTYFLTRLVQRFEHLKDMEVHTAYPNYGLLSEDRRKCVIFHHGHFIESMYQLMSTLRKLIFGTRMPDNVWDIEAQNFAWIDFFWSTMGRSGEVGQDVEVIYEKMQDPDEFKELLSGMVDNLARLYNLPGGRRADR